MKKTNSSGFTLVETTVTILLITIVIAVSGGIIISVGNIFSRNAMIRNAQNVGNSVYELLSEKLKYCTALSVGESPADVSGVYTESIYISPDGDEVTISRQGIPEQALLSDDTRAGCLVMTEIGNVANECIEVTVSVYHGDIASSKLLYTINGTVPLLNYNADGNFSVSSHKNIRDLYIKYSFLN